MQLDKRRLAVLGLKSGTLTGLIAAFLLAGAQLHVSVEIDVNAKDAATPIAAQIDSELEAPTLRFD